MFNILLTGILLSMFLNIMPITIFVLYKQEKQKAPEEYEKVEQDFINFMKGE